MSHHQGEYTSIGHVNNMT